MAFDFTSIIDRRGRDALALDALGSGEGMAPDAPGEGFDAIPMWVADMNFPVLPSIQRALAARVAEPHFGYFEPRREYLDAIVGWQRERNGATDLDASCIGYENGVLGGVLSAVCAFAAPGDSVLVHSPTYIGFTGALESAGYRIELSPLVRDEAGIWRMDFDDMARRLEERRIHVAVFCSPHNPLGRVWERSEVERAMEVFAAHDCVVVSDEIWSDIILPGHRHTPTASVSPDARSRTVSLYAPSKTFNLAGLVGSYHVIFDPYLRDRVRAQGSKSHYNEMNVLSMHALMGAYTPEGAAWVDELCGVIDANVDAALGFFDGVEGVEVARPEGTYMLFLDCGGWCAEHGRSIDELIRAGWRVGVAWQDGRPFHGPSHIRMNLALPRSRVQEALRRLAEHVF